jgi:hypothetical protein
MEMGIEESCWDFRLYFIWNDGLFLGRKMGKCFWMVLILISLEIHPGAFAQEVPTSPKGLGASMMFGVNACVGNEETGCDGGSPSAGIVAGFLYRFSPSLAGEASFLWGQYHMGSKNLGVFMGPKAFLPLGPVGLTGGLGVGWSKYKGNGVSNDGFAMVLSGGPEFRLNAQMTLGLSALFHLPLYSGSGHSHSFHFNEIIVGASTTYYFGI